MTDYAKLIQDLQEQRGWPEREGAWIDAHNAVVDAAIADIATIAAATDQITHSAHDAQLIEHAAKLLVGLIRAQRIHKPGDLE